MSPLRVPKFIPIRARIRVLCRILRCVRNEDEEEKNEEILFARISEMAEAISFKSGM